VTPLLSTAILRTQSDERLVALARDGHERAFEALIERYRKPLMRHVRRVLPEARAEDALQQAFLNAWTALERGVEVREPRAWLYRVSQNAALNALRSPGYDYAELRDSLRSPHAGPDEDHERRWVIGRTLASIAALPENQREALLRTAVEGRSQEQVAAELGLSEGAVRGLVYRARTTLRAAATAVTPSPLIGWAVAIASGGAPATERIAQIAAGGGTASVGAALAKTGAVVAVTGILATGAVTVRDQGGGRTGEDKAEAETVGSHPAGAGAVPTVASVTGAGQATGAALDPHRPDGHGLGKHGRSGNNGRGPSGKDHGQFGEHGRGNPQGRRNDPDASHGKSGDVSHGSPGEKHIESGGRGSDSSGSGSSGSGHDGGTITSEHSGSGSGSSGSGDGGGSNSGPGGGGETPGSGDGGGGSGSGSSGDGGGTTTSSDGNGGSGSSGPGPGTTTTSSRESGDGSSSSGSHDSTTTDIVPAPTS
jgi:RNA polymerase sigma factor (sigma-70 family)